MIQKRSVLPLSGAVADYFLLKIFFFLLGRFQAKATLLPFSVSKPLQATVFMSDPAKQNESVIFYACYLVV